MVSGCSKLSHRPLIQLAYWDSLPRDVFPTDSTHALWHHCQIPRTGPRMNHHYYHCHCERQAPVQSFEQMVPLHWLDCHLVPRRHFRDLHGHCCLQWTHHHRFRYLEMEYRNVCLAEWCGLIYTDDSSPCLLPQYGGQYASCFLLESQNGSHKSHKCHEKVPESQRDASILSTWPLLSYSHEHLTGVFCNYLV